MKHYTCIQVNDVEDVPVTVHYSTVPCIERVEMEDGREITLTSAQETAMEKEIGAEVNYAESHH